MLLDKKYIYCLKSVLLIILFSGLVSTPARALPTKISPALYNKLQQKAVKTGGAHVIVRVNTAFTLESKLKSNQKREQRDRVLRVQDEIISSLNRLKYKNIKKFRYVPYMAMEVDAATLTVLQNLPGVVAIEEDEIVPPTLTDTVPLTGANIVSAYGYGGLGQTVAILDTGVETKHDFFQNKIIAEACFSTTSGLNNSTTLCPNGLSTQVGLGAGINCADLIDSCWHGTHVAGIAAGNGAGRRGIALDASIISIQIYSRFDGALCGAASPCALSYESDQIRALEYVYSLHTNYKIAAVNLSLGGSQYFNTCDTVKSAYKTAIDNLLSVGIATVVASGNDGYTNSTNSPGCISTAVTVGSTTKFDSVSNFSNSADWVDLLAPGSNINSSKPGNTFGLASGTSMATPHVVGAWAALKSKWPEATVDEILAALRNSGISILDARNGRTIPRIQIDVASNAFVQLNPGLNIIGAHNQIGITTTYELLQALGNESDIDQLEIFDPQLNTFQKTFYQAGVPAGNNSTLQDNSAVMVYAKTRRFFRNDLSRPCSPISLTAGFNLVEFNCAQLPNSAFSLLSLFPITQPIKSVKRLHSMSDKWNSAVIDKAGAVKGNNFTLSPGIGYIVETSTPLIIDQPF